MTLSPRETEKVWFDAILKSKHARYIDGVRVIAQDLVAGDELPPGTVMGKEEGEEHYGPVTWGEVDTITHGTDEIEVENTEDLWNFQVGDELDILDEDFESQDRGDNDLTITEIDYDDNIITVETLNEDTGSEDYGDVEYVVKKDGTEKGVFVCLQHIDLSHEDQLVGGILHGAVYKDRLKNFYDKAEDDLPMIAFE